MTETKHSPGPASIPYKDCPSHVRLGEVGRICLTRTALGDRPDDIDIANAARIVTCWNAYDNLVAACKWALGDCEEMLRDEPGKHGSRLLAAADVLHAVIPKAEGDE